MILPRLEFSLEVGWLLKGAALTSWELWGGHGNELGKVSGLGNNKDRAPSGSLIPDLLHGDIGSSRFPWLQEPPDHVWSQLSYHEVFTGYPAAWNGSGILQFQECPCDPNTSPAPPCSPSFFAPLAQTHLSQRSYSNSPSPGTAGMC